jgi:ubiquinone/menaquinone biosynthesis C-methylase UbiE
MIYKLLEVPALYRAMLGLVGASNLKHFHAANDRVFGKTEGCVLDVGCGPRLLSPKPKGMLVGLDINPRYLDEYRTFQDEETNILPVAGSAFVLPFADGSFDEVRCAAVLHHLSDVEAQMALREMHRVLRAGSRIVIFDFVVPERRIRFFFAWLITQLDRGEYVRRKSAYFELLARSCGDSWEIDEFRYSWLGLHGTLSVFQKS